ncbi:MAG: TRAP transporter small permease subunit, partial [Pseudanabaena sp. RU_4_16]|nr:TRAP transporter small permease subunit [Pseudanabaena sp. RU_4_16]
MMFVSAEVLMRYGFNSPIPGHLELSELLMPIIVFLALSYTQATHGHVGMDFLLDALALPERWRLKLAHYFWRPSAFHALLSRLAKGERPNGDGPAMALAATLAGETQDRAEERIAAYLEEKYPSPSILPKTPADRAHARFLEEFADTRMADIFLWRCFNAVVIKPGIWGEERDIEGYRAALAGPVVEI